MRGPQPRVSKEHLGARGRRTVGLECRREPMRAGGDRTDYTGPGGYGMDFDPSEVGHRGLLKEGYGETQMSPRPHMFPTWPERKRQGPE